MSLLQFLAGQIDCLESYFTSFVTRMRNSCASLRLSVGPFLRTFLVIADKDNIPKMLLCLPLRISL